MYKSGDIIEFCGISTVCNKNLSRVEMMFFRRCVCNNGIMFLLEIFLVNFVLMMIEFLFFLLRIVVLLVFEMCCVLVTRGFGIFSFFVAVGREDINFLYFVLLFCFMMV